MIYAVKCVLGRQMRVVLTHSLNKNYYWELPDYGRPITDELLGEIETIMRITADQKLTIERYSLPLEAAIREAEAHGLRDKARLLKYSRTSTAYFYKLDWFFDYLFGQMAPDTGHVRQFNLIKRSNGFVLQFPAINRIVLKGEQETGSLDSELVGTLPNIEKITEVLNESKQWARILKVDTVGALNDQFCATGSGQIIRTAEALHEKKTGYLADSIVNGKKRIVLIAGPSSSGKTTFAYRLATQLRVVGVTPHILSLDNYYLNRVDIPKDENGDYDFETIDALDTLLIESHLVSLLNGETVKIPTLNFLTGVREYKGNTLTLRENDVLIMEGIHGLNERISASISRADKFKIFISALTQLNIDDHNRIPTTDTRLLRRIVRDYQFRGYSAGQTIAIWPSVQRGENKYIFPYQEEADGFFNSALVYELCVLKQYAEPLLFGVSPDTYEYTEARRLIKFLDCFIGISSENVPKNSILREFLGGSCY
jgi:uridine kinase